MSKAKSKTLIRGRGWKAPNTMASDKYVLVSQALMQVLTKKGMRYGDVVDRVAAKVRKKDKNFEGAIWHYTLRCLRELETQGKVKRDLGPPTLYSKAKR